MHNQTSKHSHRKRSQPATPSQDYFAIAKTPLAWLQAKQILRKINGLAG